MKGYLSELMSRTCALPYRPHADPFTMQTVSIEAGQKPYENHTMYSGQSNTVHHEL